MDTKLDTKTYTTKKMDPDLHVKLKIMAAKMDKPLWQVFNEALERGVREMEKEVIEH